MSRQGAIQGASEGAQAGSAAGPWGALAGGIAGGALGSMGGSEWTHQKRAARYAKKMALAYDRRKWAANVRGAKEAGLHPLFALGSGGGGGTGFSMPGQSPRGSAKATGLIKAAVNAYQLRPGAETPTEDLVEDQNMNTALRIIESGTSNEQAARIEGPIKEGYREVDPAQVQPHNPNDRSKNLGLKSIWTDSYVIPGSKQKLAIPGDDIGEVFDSVPLMAATYMHPQNKPIIDKLMRDNFPKSAYLLDGPQKIISLAKKGILASADRGTARRKARAKRKYDSRVSIRDPQYTRQRLGY